MIFVNELRCSSGIKFGEVSDQATGLLEVVCRSNRCGKRPGVVVFHRFDLNNRGLPDTREFADPKERREKHDIDTVRSA